MNFYSKFSSTICSSLSMLPDEILLQILSYLSIKDSVKTSVFSKRYRTLYASLPDLIFDIKSFTFNNNLRGFVNRVLALRDDSIKVNKLVFRDYTLKPPPETLLRYAIDHGVEHIEISQGGQFDLPECFYNLESDSLATLELASESGIESFLYRKFGFKNLVSLTVDRFMLKVPDIFSECHSLRELTLSNCYSSPDKRRPLKICAPQVSKLTILDNSRRSGYALAEIMISMPRLTVFEFNGCFPVHIISKDCDRPLLQTATIMIRRPFTYRLITMLEFIKHAKLVALSRNILKCLSIYQGLLLLMLPPFQNLTCFNILQHTDDENDGSPEPSENHVVTRVTYLLKDSPNAVTYARPRPATLKNFMLY